MFQRVKWNYLVPVHNFLLDLELLLIKLSLSHRRSKVSRVVHTWLKHNCCLSFLYILLVWIFWFAWLRSLCFFSWWNFDKILSLLLFVNNRRLFFLTSGKHGFLIAVNYRMRLFNLIKLFFGWFLISAFLISCLNLLIHFINEIRWKLMFCNLLSIRIIWNFNFSFFLKEHINTAHKDFVVSNNFC